MELNLCEILKGHEGEVFYCTLCGEVIIISISGYTPPFNNPDYPIVIKGVNGPELNILRSNGHFLNEDRGECVLFPSKDQRDWNKWVEEQEAKVPKTWSNIKDKNIYYFKVCNDLIELEKSANVLFPIEKSALALLKINQLIEVGYGGNITDKEWNRYCYPKYFIEYNNESKIFRVMEFSYSKSHIAFHTKEQAEEFLKYPENVQLLKDYFMI